LFFGNGAQKFAGKYLTPERRTWRETVNMEVNVIGRIATRHASLTYGLGLVCATFPRFLLTFASIEFFLWSSALFPEFKYESRAVLEPQKGPEVPAAA
jgi:hypothetical protein